MKVICPVCSVCIEDDRIVHYSYGKPQDKKHLFFKVCQHAQKKGCINNINKSEVQVNPYNFLDAPSL